MVRIKVAYVGGASSRAPGTLASFVEHGADFAGSEIVLIDLDPRRLEIVRTLGRKMARARDLDLTVTATTDRRAGMEECDAVLTSFRPGGFEARHLDESIPLRHGLIGQETQGPGGFFMALRAIHVMQGIVHDMERVCPDAWLVNYTNPINIVSQAVSAHSPVRVVSLCEGPIIFPRILARAADLDPNLIDATMIGLNHACWSVRHSYAGDDLMPLIEAAYERTRRDPAARPHVLRLLELAATMQSVPAEYFLYYYYTDEILAEMRTRPTTRAQDILAAVPDYWAHYETEAAAEAPSLDPQRSRGGINELELAVDVLAALVNDRGEVYPVNVPNRGAICDFPDDLVVEVPAHVDRRGILPLVQPPLPRHVVGLVKMLGEYQALAAEAAWSGSRMDAIRALAANPLIRSVARAAHLYDEMAAAHRDYLPPRLLAA